MEEWKTYKITNFRGGRKYEVSDEGNAKINGILVDFSKSKRNYYSFGGKHLHRIVAELFVPNTNNYPCVDHINGDTHDNRAINLRWCTHKMNNSYPLARIHKSEAQKIVWSDPERKKTNSDILKGRTPWNKGKTGLQIGWNKGKDCSMYRHDFNKNRIWINNGVINKLIDPNDLQIYESNGFKLGRLKFR